MSVRKKYVWFVLGLFVVAITVTLSLSKSNEAASSQYGFLYADQDYCNRNYSISNDNTYQVVEGKLIKKSKQCGSERKHLKLYLFHNGENKEITYEEAKNIQLDVSPISPDSYEIIFQKKTSFLCFITENSCWNTYQKKGLTKSKIEAHVSQGSRSNFYFLGWVL